ncbi:MAG: DUF4932 domain-containing protein [Phycisphaerales bacterium]
MLISALLSVVLMLVPQTAAPGATPGQLVPPAGQPGLHAMVDPRVEFMSAVARTAGFEEYAMDNATSPYSKRVDELFAPYKNHPAFTTLRSLRNQHGVSFDAVMCLAMHVTAPPLLQERVDFAAGAPRLDKRLDPEATRALLVQLRDLAKAVKWMDFMERENSFYVKAAGRLAAAANQAPLVEWFDANLGVRMGASYVLVPGLLNGGGCYGVGVQFPDGKAEELRPVIGCWKWDSEGLPVFDSNIVPLVAHELCHSYTNALVDRHAAELTELGNALYAVNPARMQRQAYGNGITVMYETLVRACVVRCMHDILGPDAGKKAAEEEVKAGFLWVPALAEAMATYQKERSTYPTLDAFVPQIKAVLEKELAAAQKVAGDAPRLVSSQPAAGAQGVKPGDTQLRLEFDRAMRTDSFSITGSKDDVPANIKLVRTENDGKVWIFSCTMAPGRTYTIGLNSPKFQGFKASNGTPLEPVRIRFSTAAQ